ncbi:MAG: AraC family transcriptional regulator, partial [Pseudomonadota bacterium]
DQAHMFEALHHPSLSQGLCLSKAMLGIATSETIDFDLMNPNRTYTRLLHAELDRLYTPLLAGAQSIPRPQFERFVACVRMLVHKERQEDDVRTQARDALRDLICDHIEHRLASADLSADSLLSEFGVSRASLYRMFEADGGVRSYINNRRLFRAVHMISSNPLRRGQVTQAAERWGFNSPVSFNRSVRRVYGTAPGSLFRQPLRPIVTPLYSAPFERFLARSTHHRKSQSRSQPARVSAA